MAAERQVLNLHPDIIEALKWGAVLLVVLLAGIAVLIFLRSRRPSKSAELDEDMMLIEFRELYRQGKLSAEEFRGIRMRLTEELRQRTERPKPGSGA